ncbi:MAG TPA: prepilin peptidase, partial [Blastocatellia bacterium]|nr:prepilin peptidase [Blastocatellia bacterium]
TQKTIRAATPAAVFRKVMMEQLSPAFVGFSVFVFGMLIGSFLNVVIYRVPRRESIAFPGSHCPACNVAIKPYDNIPVVSYAMLRGRCRNCEAGISPIYPAIELLVAALYLGVFFIVINQYPDMGTRFWLTLIADVLFVSLIVPLVFIDLRYKLLPNVITYPGFALMVVMRVLAPDPWLVARTPKLYGGATPEWITALTGALVGAAVGGGSLWLVREAYYRLRHVEGMGLGDVKMMLMVGAFLGWQLTLLTIFLASLLGSVIGIMLIKMRGGNMKMEIPFGVFLGPASVVALFVGQGLLDWYLKML